jgi:hypothetical protein
MNEQMETPQSNPAQAAPQPAVPPKGPAQRREVSNPREVAALVMTRLQQAKARRDEMGKSFDDVVDIAQQLTHAYARQVLVIEQLRRRLKALEASAAANAPSSTTVQ